MVLSHYMGRSAPIENPFTYSESSTQEEFQCPVCPASFGSEKAQMQHQQAKGHFGCVCGITFASLASLDQHRRAKGDACLSQHYPEFQCPVCPASFGSENALLQHQHAKGHFRCVCGKEFRSLAALDQHRRAKGDACLREHYFNVAESSASSDSSVACCVVQLQTLNELRFSQKSCSESFMDGSGTIWDTADSFAKYTRKRDIPMVKARWNWKDGHVYALDHRRLAAMKIANHRGDIGRGIKVDMYGPDIDDNPIMASDYDRKNTTTTKGMKMRINGTGIDVDIQGRLWKDDVEIHTVAGWRPFRQ